MKKRYLIALFCLLLGSASFVTAKPPLPPPMRLENTWRQEDRILSKISVTDEQKERINLLREALRKDIEPLKSQRYELMAELKLLWMDPDASGEKIRIKAKAFHELIWILIEREMEYRIELRGVLTREQYLKFLEAGGFR